MTGVVEERASPAVSEDASEGHDVFISYSRSDTEFVRRLHASLLEQGKKVFVDWDDIPSWSPDWQADLYAAIEGSDTFVYVLGPEALRSANVERELNHAVEQGKRLKPLQLHEVSHEQVPDALRKPQWTDFQSPERFDDALEELLGVLNTDPEWVHGHTRLLVDANEWKDHREDRSFLLGRTALKDAEVWLTQQAGKDPPPSELQMSYIAASRKAAALRRRITLSAVLFGLAVAIGLAVLAFLQREEAIAQKDRAQMQARIATSQALAGQAVGELDTRLDLALLLSLEAYRVEPTSEARRSVLVAMQRSARTNWILRARVQSVALSANGKTLATGGEDGTVRLWDVAGRRPLGEPLAGHEGQVNSLAFSPDGETLASAGDDGTVRLWDVAGRRQLGEPLAGHEGSVGTVAFSPNGETLASTDNRGVRLWDVAGRRQLGEPLAGHEGWVVGVTFSPNGETLASTGADGTVRLWDVAGRRQLGEPLAGHEGGVWSVAFSPNGETLASTGEDGTVRLWDVAGRRPLGEPLAGHEGQVNSLAFSPDGETLASAGDDGTVRLWDVAGHRPLGEPLAGHDGGVWSVAFSPDGETLATGGIDWAVRLWDVAGRRPLGEPLAGHERTVRSVAFSPDGETLASAGDDGTVRLWDVAGRRQLGEPLAGHEDTVWSVAFSPDGETLASAGEDQRVMLWDGTLWTDDFGDWRDRLCNIVARNLTPSEWADFRPGAPHTKTCPQWPMPVLSSFGPRLSRERARS